MALKLGNTNVYGATLGVDVIAKTKFNKLGLYPTTIIKFVTVVDVICQYKNMAFGTISGFLKVSTDNSNNFDVSVAFADADTIRAGHIFANGNIMFTTRDNKIYLTNTSLTTPVEKTLFESDGVTPYVLHTPSNVNYPGFYYEILTYQERDVNETLHVFGNYGNAHESGASPTNIYYSNDNGETYKIAYEFGQNPNYRDDGTDDGSDSSGTLLGDSGNSNLCRHMHSIGYDSVNDKWYAVVGDHLEPSTRANFADEINWYEGVYTISTDTWVWTIINFGAIHPITTFHHLKALQPIFYNGHVFWGSDNQGTTDPLQNGLWRCKISELTDETKHRQIFSIDEDYKSSIVDFRIDRLSGILFGAINYGYFEGVRRERLFMITEFGLGTLSIYKDTSADFLRISDKNDEGYYMIDYDGRTIFQAKSFFIRFGNDLLKNI